MVWFLEEGLNPVDCKIVLDMDENSETYGSIETIAPNHYRWEKFML